MLFKKIVSLIMILCFFLTTIPTDSQAASSIIYPVNQTYSSIQVDDTVINLESPIRQDGTQRSMICIKDVFNIVNESYIMQKRITPSGEYLIVADRSGKDPTNRKYFFGINNNDFFTADISNTNFDPETMCLTGDYTLQTNNVGIDQYGQVISGCKDINLKNFYVSIRILEYFGYKISAVPDYNTIVVAKTDKYKSALYCQNKMQEINEKLYKNKIYSTDTGQNDYYYQLARDSIEYNKMFLEGVNSEYGQLEGNQSIASLDKIFGNYYEKDCLFYCDNYLNYNLVDSNYMRLTTYASNMGLGSSDEISLAKILYFQTLYSDIYGLEINGNLNKETVGAINLLLTPIEAQVHNAKVDDAQDILDTVSVIPIIGTVAGGANMLIYVGRGELAAAGIEATFLVPFGKTLKGGLKVCGLKAASKAAELKVTKLIVKTTEKIEKLGLKAPNPNSLSVVDRDLFKAFDEHFADHVVEKGEFGVISKEDYFTMAIELATSGSNKNILIRELSGGRKAIYDVTKNELVIVHNGVKIGTFFKPKQGIEYFNNLK
ncbi:MAG: hypothetical protein PHO80_01990 [Candidatus Gracilibacteria bacterium]|nr:hypothetical protein [Candidatus Gracilibacteria bacterium]MDD4530302.1 hypothetical protein [Candidatus Gracilibacteria bacterium]